MEAISGNVNQFLWPKLRESDVDNIWFQQGGAPCHTARLTMTLIREEFDERVISRGAEVAWPPRSCDLTPLDFFLWGFLKSKVYANRPGTLEALENNIRREISPISVSLCEKVVENMVFRTTTVAKARGGHLADIVFHV